MSQVINPKQIRKIKTMAGKIFGRDDEAYREMLWGVAKVKSCTELGGIKIDLVIKHLEKCLGQRPVGARDRRLHTKAKIPPPHPSFRKGGSIAEHGAAGLGDQGTLGPGGPGGG